MKRNMTTVKINGKEYKAKKMNVIASAYTSSPKEGGSLTYTGSKLKWGVIATDFKTIPLYSKVYIPQFNMIFVALDTGSAIKNNKIDIYMTSYKQAINWGLKNIDIYILE